MSRVDHKESSERWGFNGYSSEQAVAKALLWILRRERDAECAKRFRLADAALKGGGVE